MKIESNNSQLNSLQRKKLSEKQAVDKKLEEKFGKKITKKAPPKKITTNIKVLEPKKAEDRTEILKESLNTGAFQFSEKERKVLDQILNK